MNRSMPGLPVHHQLPEFTQTHVHRVSDAIQPSHPLLSPSPLPPIPPSIHGRADKPISVYWWYSSNIPQTDGLNNRSLFSHSSRAWQAPDQVPAGLWGLWALETDSWQLKGLRTRGSNTVGPSPSPKAPERRVSMSKGKCTRVSRSGREQISPPPTFLSCSGPQWIMPTASVTVMLFIQSDSKANLSQ